MNRCLLSLLSMFCLAMSAAHGWSEEAVPLPTGVRAVWDLDKADRVKSPTRERICLNGLWRWQPAKDAKAGESRSAPSSMWGYFKVPGNWTDSTQTLFAHSSWSGENPRATGTAWYQREIAIPKDWAGRRITVTADYLNSLAALFIDGKEAAVNGKAANLINFPGGEVDITALCRPGEKHILSALVFALPLDGVMLSYADSAAPKAMEGPSSLAHRGFCGDVYLIGTPAAARIGDVKIRTSFRNGEITVDSELQDLKADARYALRGRILDGGKKIKEFTGKPFAGADLKENRMAVVEKWLAEKLWDTNTPQNMYQLELSLLDASGKELDTALPVRFGFREMWIDGRDFRLNGTRIFLSGISMENADRGAAFASYAMTRESLERMKTFGINFVYTGNFGCLPGAHLGFEEILRAADDVGMLVSFTQPHMGHYEGDWQKPAEEDGKSTYARHAEFYVRMAENHPSVVCYSMNHNAGGYNEDMDPDQMNGTYKRDGWLMTILSKQMRSQAIVRHLDPSRIIYHHGGGDSGDMHTSNFYANFTPIQELSDWFERWSSEGNKPIYTNEYAGPGSMDWTMYRGWYDEKRLFSNKPLRWEYCIAEWNSQFLGDRAFQISENEKVNLRFESKQAKTGKLWYRWDYPFPTDSYKVDEQNLVYNMYFTDNFRAYRTWGVSGISPWEYYRYWKLRDGADTSQKAVKTDWENLQRPGFNADVIDFGKKNYELFPYAYERADWIASPSAQALYRNNMPLLAYIGGKAAHFTSKDHDFTPGEAVEKQLIIINNSRATVSCECSWSLALTKPISGTKKASVTTGEQERIPLHFDLPVGTAPGSYLLTATVKFSTGETQQDTFPIQALPTAQKMKLTGKIALFDPKGETGTWLTSAGVACQNVEAGADLSSYDTLIVGKAALTVDGAAPDIARVHDGLKVIMFEQTAEVLEKRFGFRVVEYGLRNVFARVPDHPMLAGLNVEHLHDWRGEATIMPARAQVTASAKFKGAPAATWCDILMPKIWRCGCRGNVASVLIEKPACGDFLPVVDGGYSLQFSPLMEYHDGKGLMIFCQMDVTGRTESDPAAAAVTRNILSYVSAWKPSPIRKVLYAGDAAGKSHLEKTGMTVTGYDGAALSADQVLVVGAGGEKILAANAPAIAGWLKAGGNLLALGLDEAQANAFLPVKVSMKTAEHIATCFDPPALNSGLAGVGPADVHNRDPRDLPLVSGGATVIGDGVLAKSGNVVFCQMVPWQFAYTNPQYLKRTFRRSSCLVTRLLSNMGVAGSTPILERFHRPVDPAKPEQRWLNGIYLDEPDEWNNPYRFFRW